MQFNVNGSTLELQEGFDLQFTRKNILFAFDNIECERSVSFDIPATPNNMRIFSLAQWVQTNGIGMRRRYDAQLIDGIIIKDGYLYISKYENKKYKAVFVTGELLGLQRIKNAGKIAEIVTFGEHVVWDITSFSPAAGRDSVFEQIRYDTKADAPLPSVRLQTVLEVALQNLNANYTLPNSNETIYARYIPDKLNGIKEQQIEMDATAAPMSTGSDYPICYDTDLGVLQTLFGQDLARVQRTIGVPATTIYRGRVRQLIARQNIQITFPASWNDDLFIGYFNDGDSNLLTEFTFYGDREFDEYGIVSGDSLRGRSVKITRGEKFTIINKEDYINEQTSSGLMLGWDFAYSRTFEFAIKGLEVEFNSDVRLQDNLPDVTVVDLLKTFAAISGLQLNYTEAIGITFEDLNFDNWSVFDINGKVIDDDNCVRKFGDYAQKNIVQFSSDENIPDTSRIRQVYEIDNDNLTAEKELYKIPFSEGENTGEIQEHQLLGANETKTIADASVNVQALTRIHLNTNSGIMELCDASTCITVQARMNFMEYEQRITPKTIIFHQGSRYAWIEAQYNKGVVKMELAKI